MEQEIEDLNHTYRQELGHFINLVDFSSMESTEKRMIQEISDYFQQHFRSILTFRLVELENIIAENFNYGVERSKQITHDIGVRRFENLQDFEKTNNYNYNERNRMKNSFDINNPSNCFADLETRIAMEIDSYLIRQNYDNQNYERYHDSIKIFIKNYISHAKEKMLVDIKTSLDIQNQQIEKEMLTIYRSLLKQLDNQVGLSEATPTISTPILEPIIDSEKSELPIINYDIKKEEALPGNVLK